VYQRWQKADRALEHYTNATQKNEAEPAYLLARAEMLVALGRSGDALSLLQDRLPRFEHNAVMHHTIGQLLLEQGSYAKAVDSLRQASILATDDLSIREHLAMAMYYNGQYREAGDAFTRLLKDETNSKRADLWIALGECQMQTGRAGDARASFDTATQHNPSSATAWLSLAKAALQLGDTRRAEVCLRKAVSIDPASSEAHLMFGYLRLRQNNLKDAMTEFQKASALDHNDPVSLCMIGYVLEKSGRPQQAIRYYAQALKVKPDDELASRLMASVGGED
jgi:tetratricopeptide (TPR) repeat protein